MYIRFKKYYFFQRKTDIHITLKCYQSITAIQLLANLIQNENVKQLLFETKHSMIKNLKHDVNASFFYFLQTPECGFLTNVQHLAMSFQIIAFSPI